MSGTGAAANAATKVGRNEPCPCGSGKKFKHCCGDKGANEVVKPAASGAPSAAARTRLNALFHEAEKRCNSGHWSDAVPLFEEIARLDPNSPQAHHDLGIAYLHCGRLVRASASLQRAVELRPSFQSALRHLIDTLEPLGREQEALSACRKLSRTADDPAERRYYTAKALLKEGNTEEAEVELRRLIALAPGSFSLELGRLLSSRGRFSEAEVLLTQATQNAPGAFQSLAEIKRMSEADRPLIERMEAALERPDLEAMARAAVHFGLGKAYDDLRDPPAAMRHFDSGNKLRALSSRLNRMATAAEFDGVIKAFTAEALESAARSLTRPEGADDDLPVLIVGMPRSGTTLVEQILSSHPSVAAGGELSFWKERLGSWRASRDGGSVQIKSDAMFKAADDYYALLRGLAPTALRVTDKAPRNFELLWLPFLALPKARIIHCRRHPVDTCLSIYFTNFLGTQDFAWDRSDLVFYYRQYERLMDHWRRVLPPHRFTEVQYETLVADGEAETRRLISFLGLDWDDACLAPERNQRVVHTASLWQARQPVYRTSMARWRRYEPWLGELRELIPASERSPGPTDALSAQR